MILTTSFDADQTKRTEEQAYDKDHMLHLFSHRKNKFNKHELVTLSHSLPAPLKPWGFGKCRTACEKQAVRRQCRPRSPFRNDFPARTRTTGSRNRDALGKAGSRIYFSSRLHCRVLFSGAASATGLCYLPRSSTFLPASGVNSAWPY